VRDTCRELADGGHFFGLQQLLLRFFDLVQEEFEFLAVSFQLDIGLAELRGALSNKFFQMILVLS